MKKITLLLILFYLFSCSNSLLTPKEIEELTTKDVEIVFLTNEPNYDEVVITYYDFTIGTDISKTNLFKYDVDGNPLPLKIIFKNYSYKIIRGEGFRNNFSEAELKVQIFIDNILVKEQKSNGSSSTFARVDFNFNITN